MPKRSLNLFTEDEDTDYKVSELFTEDELLEDKKCSEILENQFHYDFEKKLEDKIHQLFKYYSSIFHHKDFLYDNDQYTGDNFLPILYNNIHKSYDFELLYENHAFTYHLFENKHKNKKVSKKVSKKIIITNTKKHVWG